MKKLMDLKNIIIMICIIIIIILVVLQFTSSKKDNSVSYHTAYDKAINSKYQEMKDQLIKHGETLYENEYWLNKDAKVGVYFYRLMDLKDLEFDISLFVNPRTKQPCDERNTKIEFNITEISESGDFKYNFNPVLACE